MTRTVPTRAVPLSIITVVLADRVCLIGSGSAGLAGISQVPRQGICGCLASKIENSVYDVCFITHSCG